MSEKLKVVLCWHMHQPAYFDSCSNQYKLPWTYLHGIKDYVDMAAHLEAVPNACAVVNFAPTLLEQIDDYVKQIQAFLRNKAPILDPLLAALNSEKVYNPFLGHKLHNTDNIENVDPKHQKIANACLILIEQCMRANEERLIKRFKPYQELTELVVTIKQNPRILAYLEEQYLIDLLMWYHLAWLGETVHRSDIRVKTLIEKGHKFTKADRLQLLEIIGELLGSIIPRYKALAENGRVELSFTPYAHPIMPLLLDINSAKDAMPDVTLPNETHYPGGEERVQWHVQEGIKTFEKFFGFIPQGCWPSEGSVSEATVKLLEKYNVKWVASGGGVLRNSLLKSGLEHLSSHQPYGLSDSSVHCFFRDDNLSDLIGFEYSNWHGDDAVANFIHHLEGIANADNNAKVVTVILDGENAWEYFPNNAYYFLNALYDKLANHADLELTTFEKCLSVESAKLSNLVAGSWVYGTFSTWIGDQDKNNGWEMLMAAKHKFDEVIATLNPEQQLAANKQLAICEGSDWCWWFGGENPSEAVQDFDHLYRLHLIQLYQLLGVTPPEDLNHAFTHGGGNPASGGVMRRG
ncbi:glycoside hydrolase family 57 protein [Thiotrichales bacterium HSG1]|nr:glycoside hydrolase family 57 protein [Thiotrichales bacterium HSG1]